MICKEIIKYIEEWAPKEIAWQKDNVGLQIGSVDRKIKNILLCLELTNEVIDDAIKKGCNLIVSHHPLLFSPLKRIDLQNDKNSKLIERLIKKDITLYSAHTNLDFTKGGVSFELAKVLKLKNIDFLSRAKSNQYKLAVFVPAEYIEKVADAIFEAGGGKIGGYNNCSFRTSGTGTFKGSANSNPAIGEMGKYEKVNEVKLEVLVDSWKVKQVLAALFKSHPYEEVAYDIYPLENSGNYGAGAIGELESPLSKTDFLKFISTQIKVKNFRYVDCPKNKIKKVAVCGGAGSDLLNEAIYANADAFITADIKYHLFHDAKGKILLVDAGHYETEIHSLNELKRRLTHFIGINNSNIKIFKFNGSTNPIIFYNN
ncbi:MAG: Nif3-like dinuclear metal center hexameric protein [Ignavibacteriaceae bacterium]|nr:Nif3-like dinuclear metal center hexameric protein [Ignavibacteriaceae bacterium]